METTKLRLIKGLITGAIATSVFVVVITIFGELLPPLKNFLADAHHHHWVGKGIWSAIVFVAVMLGSLLVFRGDDDSMLLTSRLIRYLSHALLAGTAILLLFFVYEFYAHL